MRNVLISLFLLLSLSQPMTAQVQPIWPENLDVLPRFSGGPDALSKYMNDNLQYPESAEKKGVEGKVYVLFNVEKDGTITDVKIGKSVDPDLDQEAIRLVKGMPKWEPGRKRGKTTLVKNMRMPITFKLDKDVSNTSSLPQTQLHSEVATFPGGQRAMYKYLNDNFHPSEESIKNSIKGVVVVSFWVESDGSIIDIEASPFGNKVDDELTKKAVLLIAGMPKWLPGMKNGKLIRGFYELMIHCQFLYEKKPAFSLKGPIKIEEGKDRPQVLEPLYETDASFPGGTDEMYKFLLSNFKKIDAVKSNKIHGQIVIEFVVKADGTLTDFNVAQSIGPTIDEEILRVIKSMPKWIPAQDENGKKVSQKQSMPFVF